MIDIEKLKKEIVKRLKPLKPEKIILFGSYAWGKVRKDSDIDIYVVTKDYFIPQNFKEKNKIYLKVANIMQSFLRQYPTDLIVHTKEMHKKFLELNSSFCREISNKGLILYESK